MPQQNNASGAKCVIVFLFAISIFFIIKAAGEINEMKAQDAVLGYAKHAYTIGCQTKVLIWIAFSFFNFYTFFILVASIVGLSHLDTPRSKRYRFRIATFMLLGFVPFMLGWNVYGNNMIKQDYFKNNRAQTQQEVNWEEIQRIM